MLPVQQLAAQGWRQGQGNETGEDHRHRHGHGEFTEQTADIALQEGNGHKHGYQYQSGRHHRKADLAGATKGGHQRRLALQQAPVDVLQHHDAVVHHQSDCQHQRQQRQQIDAVVHDPQRPERGHQGDRHRDRRHQQAARVAEKQEDHQHHQYRGDEQGGVDFLDRGADKNGVVEAGDQFHAVGQLPIDTCHFLPHQIADRQRVGGALLDHPQAHHRLAIAAKQAAVLGTGQLDPGHIPEANQVAIIALAQHQLAKVLGSFIAAIHPHDKIPFQGFQGTRGQLHVLGADGRLHVCHREIPRRQRVAIQPDPHGIDLLAGNAHPGHPLQHREPILQVTAGVVGQLQRVHTRRHQVRPENNLLIAGALAHLRRLGLVR